MCGLCDNLGVIDDPAREGCIKKCPECDTEPPWYFRMSMAAMLFGPDGPTEDDDMSGVQQRMLDARRAEEAEFLANYLASCAPHDNPCKCV